MVTVAW